MHLQWRIQAHPGHLMDSHHGCIGTAILKSVSFCPSTLWLRTVPHVFMTL